MSEDGNRPLTAKEKRQEQIKRWENSATDLECETYANPKIRVKFDDGAVFLAACSSGDLDEVKKLLKKGADINFANVDGLTALHQACIDGNLDVVKFLVENGSEIDQEDNEGWTPLHATASCGFMDIGKYLIENGANVGAVNSEAELPIDIAEDDEMIDYLQSEIDRQGIDVEHAHNIERHVMLEDANHLLNSYQNGKEMELYRHPKSGATSLHITAAKGYNEVMKILIKAGIDINLRDNDGWTPLHAASHWSQEESAKILADKNADFKARSKLGQTAFDVADEDMLEYLNELETEQKKNKPNEKELPLIKPPPLNNEKRSVSSKKESDIIKSNDIYNGENKTKKNEISLESSSSEEEDLPPPKSTGSSASREKDESLMTTNDLPKLTNDDSDIGYIRRVNNRPSSLHISSQEQPQHRLLDKSNSDGSGITKPVAATQPVQSVTRSNRENGAKTSSTPSYSSRDKHGDTPSSWRSGLRKTGSFEEKSRVAFQNTQTGKLEVERSSSYSSRFNDDNSKSENVKTARVSPILDARRAKTEAEDAESLANDVPGYQRSTSFGRRKYGTTTTPAATTTPYDNTDSTLFKRSVSYKKAVGRTESIENHDDVSEGLSKRLSPYSDRKSTVDSSKIIARVLNEIAKDDLINSTTSKSNRSSSVSPRYGKSRKHTEQVTSKDANKNKSRRRRWSLDKATLLNIKPVTGTPSVLSNSNSIRNFQSSSSLEKTVPCASIPPHSIRKKFKSCGESNRRHPVRSASADSLYEQTQSASSISETTNDTSPQNDSSAAIKTADRRRSHLQPVRDEEAEAQRRARSRRERQTRRSTQGVTLDVVEEAMRTLGKMRPQSSTDKTGGTDNAIDSTKGDSSSNLYSQSTSSSTNTAITGTPVTSLPSGYIPSDQRVKINSNEPRTSTIPSISVQDDPDGEIDKGKSVSTENETSIAAAKSTALQRRRNRKERRSTGLPDLKPSSNAEIPLCKESVQITEQCQEVMRYHDNTPVPSPYSRHFLTPESDLEWLSNLGRVTLRRKARCLISTTGNRNKVGSTGSSSSKRFSHKESFRRRSIECDLHPIALAKRNGIDRKEMSPIRSVSKRPYNGYFTKSPCMKEDENKPGTPKSVLFQKDCQSLHSRYSYGNDGSPILCENNLSSKKNERPKVRTLVWSLAKPTIQRNTTNENENIPSQSKKDKMCVSQQTICYRVQYPVLEFSKQQLNTEIFKFVGGGEGNVYCEKKQVRKANKLYNKSIVEGRSEKTKRLVDEITLTTTEPPYLLQSCNQRKKSFISESVGIERCDLIKRRLEFPANEAGEEEEIPPKDDITDPAKAEKLRETAAKYESSSLPDRHGRHRSGIRGSDSDIPSKLSDSPYSSSRIKNSENNYKKMYEENVVENDRLRAELLDAQRKVSELQTKLERAEDNSTRRQALENEKRERRALERKLTEMEQEVQNTESMDKLRVINGQLKAENTVLVRIVEKLGGSVPDMKTDVKEDVDSVAITSPFISKIKSESFPDLTSAEEVTDTKVEERPYTPDIASTTDSPTSSSPLISASDETGIRRSSSVSLPGTETITRTGSRRKINRVGPNTEIPSYSTSLHNRARLESSSSSPSLFTRSSSPRRAAGTGYSSTSDHSRISSYSPRSYTSSRKESSLSNSGSYTIPISSSRREFLRSLPPTPSLKSTSSSLRTTPTPYGSSFSKSSYGSSTSRPRSTYSSSAGRSGQSKSSGLSKYSSSELGSSRRLLKY